jgi:hypothetical protein
MYVSLRRDQIFRATSLKASVNPSLSIDETHLKILAIEWSTAPVLLSVTFAKISSGIERPETQSRSNQSSKQSYRTTAAWSSKRYQHDPLKRPFGHLTAVILVSRSFVLGPHAVKDETSRMQNDYRGRRWQIGGMRERDLESTPSVHR